MKYFHYLSQIFLDKERERLNFLLPIAFGLGIILYFCLPFEPMLTVTGTLCVLSLGGFIFLRRKESNLSLIALFLVFFLMGLVRIGIETKRVEAPFIHKKYGFVSVVGRIEKIDWQQSSIRLTLTDLSLNKIPEKEKPHKIRVRINGKKVIPAVGDIVALKATLSPPSLPFVPGGYDFSRRAFYDGLGAVGYAVSRLNVFPMNDEHTSHPIEHIRTTILNRILSILPKDTGNVAVALVTGEQGGVSPQTRDNYTTAGIVHVLSVSGFHMSLIAAFIFGILRFGFSLFPRISLRYNTKKICAILALIITFGYLLISGMAVPAIRSYLMIAFVLTAVLFDRQALSMRSVAWAGFLILLIDPAVITTASFILSFMAVMALIAGYETFTGPFKRFFSPKPWWIKYTLGTLAFFLIMNTIAHLATVPTALNEFHRYPNYALLGNFMTNTLFSLFIMPLLFIATILMPLGLDKPFYLMAGFLLDIIDKITVWISSLPYATVFGPSFTPWGYALIIIGAVWLCLWQSRIRLIGLVGIVIGFLTLFCYTPPDVFVSQGGKLLAVRQNNTYAFSSITKEKIIRRAWMESAGLNSYKEPVQLTAPVQIKGYTIDFDGTNPKADITIGGKGKCTAKLCLSWGKLWKEGVHTLYIKDDKIEVRSAGQAAKGRPWSQGVYSPR